MADGSRRQQREHRSGGEQQPFHGLSLDHVVLLTPMTSKLHKAHQIGPARSVTSEATRGQMVGTGSHPPLADD